MLGSYSLSDYKILTLDFMMAIEEVDMYFKEHIFLFLLFRN